jgi:hypothetical protein
MRAHHHERDALRICPQRWLAEESAGDVGSDPVVERRDDDADAETASVSR